ncbi:MAG TPA: hypothetical protein VFU21_08150 [Kofleriaceae bacterium]|nr:hypothetical protein [Kofleriaceae bacterium]
MSRTTRLSWVASELYLALLVVGSLAAAIWMFRFFGERGGWSAIFAEARAEGLRPTLLVGAPIWLIGAAVVGVVVILFLLRRKAWALVAAALAAPATLGALYAAHRLLLAMEERFYDRSKYVALYRKGAYPLVIVTALFALLLAIDVLVVARRRAA